ncbi:MAG: hypothetical protein ACKPKO_62080, partial [Candidatus Fonsibacter sp.]
MLEEESPMPYTFTGVRTRLARLRRFFTLADYGALPGLPSSVTLHMKEACNGDAQAARAALGDAMSLKSLCGIGQEATQCHIAMDPSPCTYESGNTLGLHMRKSHDDVSLAMCCHGSKGTLSTNIALKRASSQYLHQDSQDLGIAQRCSHRLFVSIACLIHGKVTLLG